MPPSVGSVADASRLVTRHAFESDVKTDGILGWGRSRSPTRPLRNSRTTVRRTTESRRSGGEKLAVAAVGADSPDHLPRRAAGVGPRRPSGPQQGKAAHIAIGVDRNGIKHVLGIWVQSSTPCAPRGMRSGRYGPFTPDRTWSNSFIAVNTDPRITSQCGGHAYNRRPGSLCRFECQQLYLRRARDARPRRQLGL